MSTKTPHKERVFWVFCFFSFYGKIRLLTWKYGMFAVLKAESAQGHVKLTWGNWWKKSDNQILWYCCKVSCILNDFQIGLYYFSFLFFFYLAQINKQKTLTHTCSTFNNILYKSSSLVAVLPLEKYV